VQEAALSALAALARDNFDVATVLSKPAPERPGAAAESSSGLSLALALCKSRNTDVQLAAALCATHIIRASVSNHHPSSPDLPAAMTVMHVMNRLISSSTDSPQARTKACFILKYLVTDEKELCQMAFDGGSLGKLSDLVKSITPTDKASEWDEDEADSICCLREAALTSIAVLALANDDIRRDITDNMKLVPTISTSLAHRHAGIRYAACHLVDSGLGTTLFQRLLKEDEDHRVTYAALTAICNLINEYSPLRQINYLWFTNRIFVAGFLNGLAGAITTIPSVFSAQNGHSTTGSICALAASGSLCIICGGLSLVYGGWKTTLMRREHERLVAACKLIKSISTISSTAKVAPGSKTTGSTTALKAAPHKGNAAAAKGKPKPKKQGGWFSRAANMEARADHLENEAEHMEAQAQGLRQDALWMEAMALGLEGEAASLQGEADHIRDELSNLEDPLDVLDLV
ncbi:hypothetical protein EWM64_g7033, partial [Hericium alpestre]